MIDNSTSRNGVTLIIKRIAIIAVVGSLILSGCSGISVNTKSSGKGAEDIVYQVTADEALQLAHWAIRQALPGQKIHKMKKSRLGYVVNEIDQPGHYRVARFKETTYFYEIDLLKIEGKTAQGNLATGYTYAIKGNGDLKKGPENLALLEKKMAEAFNQSGRAVAVSSAKPTAPPSGPPELAKEKPAQLSSPQPRPETSTPPVLAPIPSPVPEKPAVAKTPAPPAATEAPAPPAVKEAPAPPAASEALPDADEAVFIKLKKLKELRDQGIISEEEFKAKKKELLDRI